ncbi:hypothetical protein ERL59_06480 [Chengkuizengella sp. YPA3-1-1]|uniref:Uncharacterized protein n=2 Tax=Chengkuizengella marina TaxID=2507566 RepID=A0A6N9Q023_9BACL|nr:hypothetical protein [Chengkuizengella marina]
MKTIYLNDGDFKLDVYIKFRDTKISRLLLDFQEAFEVLRKETVSYNQVQNMMLLSQMLILKQFTNLGLEKLDMSKKEDLYKLFNIAEKLVDTGIYEQIFEQFEKDELEKINKAIEQSNQMGKQIGEIMASAINHEKIKGEDNAEGLH